MNSSTLSLFTALFFLASCSEIRYAYSPVAPNTPGFKEKNESRFAATVSVGDFTNQESASDQSTEINLNLQSAFALTNHIAVLASYAGTIKERDITHYFGNSSSSNYSNLVTYNRNQYEVGAGIFYPFTSKKVFLVECFAGYGFGKLNITDKSVENGMTTSSRFYTANTNKFFIQPSLSLHAGEVFFLSLGFRYVNTGYSGIRTSYTEQETIDYYLKDISTSRIEFIEPFIAANFRFANAPWLMLQYQYYYTNQVSTQLVNYRFSHNNMGIVIDPLLLLMKKRK
jgi:hypothetical protein